jgi:deoxyribose-phosphate aldolase
MRTVPPEAIRTPRDLAAFLDHTLLAPGATRDDLERVCREAREHRFAAVCFYGHAVADAARLLAGSGVPIAAVVDFPRGEAATAARRAEAEALVRAGAGELDLVVALPALVAGRYEAVLEDLRAVVCAVPVPVKVILETAKLTRDGVVAGAALALAAGAAFVKTSTGFGGGGATAADVTLLRSVVGDALGVKASGGIRTAADARAMIRAGASRIGTSHAVAIVSGAFPD